ncbi:hypothetical protein N7509_000330 [Penicillium cosmopolitanum]|uniref:RTA1 like protein n=1 Tax=Penicillium cosmopolitanum TaxID=1131564 RepID=A0A9X0BE49_9EURO|nr:uncharacterized protein N7509_000330 [Penicillium cosmopolitanum]KAJ5413703.1 hypothetical protein N7509_000330 [Penicillium cosmopolitanum]
MATSSTNVYGAYVPSRAAAIIVAIIFVILTALQLWRIVASRRWFGLAIVTGCLFEIVGLAARAYSHNHLAQTKPYIIQILLILLAPILFTASIYMFLGRLIKASGHQGLSFIRINWLTKIFVLGDIFCFLVQAAGAGSLVNADTSTSIDSAQNIILGGLALQVLFFCVFALCAIVFHVRTRAPHIRRSIDPRLHLNAMLFTLYFCSILVTVRNIYRLIEYKSGTTGYLQEHEWPTYGLDVALMAIIAAVTISWYSVNMEGFYRDAIPLTSRDGHP